MSQQMMNKKQWVSLFRTIGLSDETMKNWHREFEKQFPDQHQSFLEWLQISQEDIQTIRAL